MAEEPGSHSPHVSSQPSVTPGKASTQITVLKHLLKKTSQVDLTVLEVQEPGASNRFLPTGTSWLHHPVVK